jgi:hypothetical protein
MRILACFVLFAVSSVATGCAPARDAAAESLPALAGRTVLAGCRQGECQWLRVVSVDSVLRLPEGELRRMVVRRGISTHPDRNPPDRPDRASIEWQAVDSAQHAFCSNRRPAYAFDRDGGGRLVHFLDPFDLAGYQYVSAGLYMRLCHGRERLPDAADLRRLGYAPGTRSEQVEDATLATMTDF